jgi:hypothetical protein
MGFDRRTETLFGLILKPGFLLVEVCSVTRHGMAGERTVQIIRS